MSYYNSNLVTAIEASTLNALIGIVTINWPVQVKFYFMHAADINFFYIFCITVSLIFVIATYILISNLSN